MQRAFAIALLVIGFTSCKKDKLSINGLYTESIPVAGRSQLNFIGNNIVVKYEAGSNSKDSFTYSFSGNKIILKPAWTDQYLAQPFDFEKIDDESFEIENLYPGIPEAPKSYMIYRK